MALIVERLIEVGVARWLVSLLSVALVSGCVRYDGEAFEGEVLPRATGYTTGVTNDWLYLDLRTGAMLNAERPNVDVVEGEQLDRLDWDVAFCGCALRTNGGTSGPGLGAARLSPDEPWVADTPDCVVTMAQREWNRWVFDAGLDVADNPWFDPNRGPATTTTSANSLLANALVFSGPPAVYTPSNRWYEVRTADGLGLFRIKIVSWNSPQQSIGEGGGRLSYLVEEVTR